MAAIGEAAQPSQVGKDLVTVLGVIGFKEELGDDCGLGLVCNVDNAGSMEG